MPARVMRQLQTLMSGIRQAASGRLAAHAHDGPAQGGAPPQAPITAAEDAIGAYLRASVEQRRGSIFGCTGGQETTVVVSAVRDGTIAFALAGGHSGTSMEACVRMALGTPRLDPQPRAVAMLITLTPMPGEVVPVPSAPPPVPSP